MFDGGFDLDIDAVRENVAEAEVVTLYFPFLRRTLLVDTRSTDSVGPLVRVVPVARNSAERFESVQRLRPELPKPESITMIPWRRRVGSLQAAGVWDLLLARLSESGDGGSLAAARRCLGALTTLEAREFGDAIRGEHYQTLWPTPERGAAGA
jgi:hypothetical protein